MKCFFEAKWNQLTGRMIGRKFVNRAFARVLIDRCRSIGRYDSAGYNFGRE
jgi:hypothetical protein